MTPDPKNRAVDSALNGDEPAAASDAPQHPEPNGSDSAKPDETTLEEPEAAVDAPVVEEPAEPEASAEPEAAAEEPAAEAPAEPDAQAEPEAPAEVPAAQAAAPTEELAEPAPDHGGSVPEPEPVEVVPEPMVKESATEPEPERPAEVAAPAEVPSGIAADIERALQAAATAEQPEPEPEPVSVEQEAPVEAAAAEPPAVEAPDTADVSAQPDGAEAEDEVVVRAFQPGDWFVVHTYAGYENKVKTNLESRISSMNVEEKIFEVVIPMEDVMEIKSGKKQVVQRKVFPGYLLVRMDLDDDSWYVVRNTPGVTGFVGSGARPIPLSEREVDRILQRKPVGERPKPKLEWSINDPVRVTTGPFANFQGLISEIDTDRSKLKVLVNIFGRETPVELGFDQVAKV